MARQLEWPFRRQARRNEPPAGHLGRLVEWALHRVPGPVQPPAPPLEAGDFRAGLRELRRFISEVGGRRVEAPRVRGQRMVVPLHAPDGERYLLEIEVTRYLAEPPRCRFVDERGRSPATAWPQNHPAGPFRSPEFICTPPTAEYYLCHSEGRYRGEGSLENTVATVFAALYGRGYAGRCASRGGRGPARRPAFDL